MGIDRLQFGVQIRRSLIISIRTCYRSVCNHPFLVGVFCFLLFLYRLFPFGFSLLVSASPVLVCTAILLGTLLSFGQPNIPEIEKEEEVIHMGAPLRTEVSRGTTIIQGFKGRDLDEASLMEESQASEIDEDTCSVSYKPLLGESSREYQSEKEIKEFNKGYDSEIDQNIEINVAGREVLEADEDEVHDEDGDEKVVSPVSPWRPRMHYDDDDDDDDDDYSVDSGSDGAESSSPDASMADIMPVLDELHPLLDSDLPKPADTSREGSGSDGNRSTDEGSGSDRNRSSDEELESDVDSENGEEGNNGEAEEEEKEKAENGEKDDPSKSAIEWTEHDQKNLMDLGTLELERNQRLENLIARRRARISSKSMLTEKNLIDFDTADFSFNVPPISVTRRNPFDVPYDSYDDMGLPPIPGSAPSIMVPRRNPFDLPYEVNEEKPDLKGDAFQQEFSVFHQKEAMFKRHESFSVGPSFFGGSRQERQDNRLRPYFMPEKFASEGTSYSSFDRQLSELSEKSKVSSVPDTESLSSALEEEEVQEEDKKISDDEVYHDADLTSDVDQASLHDVQLEVSEITLGGAEPSLSEAVGTTTTTTVELDASDEIHSNRDDHSNEDHSDRSSISSLSEIDEKISEVVKEEEEGSTVLQPSGDVVVEESAVSVASSHEDSETHFMSGVVSDDHQHEEPVYDSSPTAFPTMASASFSSLSSENQPETPQKDSQAHVDFTPHATTTSRDSNEGNIGDEIQIRSREVENLDISMHGDEDDRLSGVDSRINGQSGYAVLKPDKNDGLHNQQYEVDSSDSESSDEEIIHKDVKEEIGFTASIDNLTSRDLNMLNQEEQVENISTLHSSVSSAVSLDLHTREIDMEGTLEAVQGFSGTSEGDRSMAKDVLAADHLSGELETEDVPQDMKRGLEVVQGFSGTSEGDGSVAKGIMDADRPSGELVTEDVPRDIEGSLGAVQGVSGTSERDGSMAKKILAADHLSGESETEDVPRDMETREVVQGFSRTSEGDGRVSGEFETEDVPRDVEGGLEVAQGFLETSDRDRSLAKDILAADSLRGYLETEDAPRDMEGTLEVVQGFSGTSEGDGLIAKDILAADHLSVELEIEDVPRDMEGGLEVVQGLSGTSKGDRSMAKDILAATGGLEKEYVTQDIKGTREAVQAFSGTSEGDGSMAKDILSADRLSGELETEDVPQFDNVEVVSSNYDATTSHTHPETDVEVGSVDSSSRDVPSEESSSSETEKEPSWSDKSVDEPSTPDHSESHEPSNIAVESTSVSFSNTDMLHEYYDAEEINSTNYTPDTHSVLSESPEYKTPMVGEGRSFRFFDNDVRSPGAEYRSPGAEYRSPGAEYRSPGAEYRSPGAEYRSPGAEYRSPGAEYSNHYPEVYESHIPEASEVLGQIKEIDEGLLSELDTVGDFRVKQVVDESVGNDESESSNRELPVLEARSIEDIESAFKQFHGANVEDVILRNIVEEQSAAEKPEPPTEIESGFSKVEAKSLEDIGLALVRTREDNAESDSTGLAPVLEAQTSNFTQTSSRYGSFEVNSDVVIKSESPESSRSEDGSAENETEHVISTEESDSSEAKSVVSEESKLGSPETSEKSSFPTASEKNEKKAKSHDSSSTSTSTSTSTPTSSDE